MRISDWSSDVCSSDLSHKGSGRFGRGRANDEGPLAAGLRRGWRGLAAPAWFNLVVDPVQVAQVAWTRAEVCGQVSDLLVGQVPGLLRHQRVLAVAVAIFLQRVREVVVVLAAELRIAGVDGRVAFLAVAVHAGLAGGLALGVGELLAGIDVALGQ